MPRHPSVAVADGSKELRCAASGHPHLASISGTSVLRLPLSGSGSSSFRYPSVIRLPALARSSTHSSKNSAKPESLVDVDARMIHTTKLSWGVDADKIKQNDKDGIDDDDDGPDSCGKQTQVKPPLLKTTIGRP
ncbi:cathepsin [Pycnococcus provasolii]